jgi:hypothetical protein
MKLLLDEGLPVQVLVPLRLNAGHEFVHIDELEWKSKGDTFLFPDAAGKGFEGVLALDVDQLTIKKEWEALRRSGLHHISVRQGRNVVGKKGLARTIASFVAAMPWVLEDLIAADEQQIVELRMLNNSARHTALAARAAYPPTK